MKWFYALPLILITLNSLQAEEISSREELPPTIESATSDLKQTRSWTSKLKEELSAQVPLAPDAAMLQESPQKLLRQAIQRQENYRESFLKTGDHTLLKSELIRAEQELQACYQLFLQIKDYNNAALCLIEKGNNFLRIRRAPDAKENYQKALELAKAHNLKLPKAKALNGLANYLVSMDEKSDRSMAEANQYAQQAEQLCKELKDYDCQIVALDELANVQSFQNNVNGALQTTDEMLTLTDKTSHSKREKMFVYITRANIYFQFAVSPTIQNNIGTITSDTKRFNPAIEPLKEAQSNFEQAIILARKQGYNGLIDKILQSQLKSVLEYREIVERSEKTREQFGTTIKNPNNRSFHPQVPEDVMVQEDFLFPSSPLKTEMDRKNFLDTIKTIEPFLLPSVSDLILQGEIHEYEGKYDLAFEDYSKVIEFLEKDRSYLTGTSREALLATAERQGIYSKATRYLLQQKRYSEAFTFMERAHARYTADLVASGRKIEWTTPQERKLFVELQDASIQIAKLQREITINTKKSLKEKEKSLGDLKSLESKYQKTLENISHQAPHLYTLLEAKPASLETLQADMRDHQYEVLYYLVEEFQVIVWHISSDQVFVRSISLLSEAVLNEKIKQLQKSFKGQTPPPFDAKMARQLFLFLIQPVLSQIKAKHLVIIPQKSLYALPFQVLLSPQNQYLGELYAISYAPSATLLLELNKLNPLKGANLLAVLDPKFTKETDAVATISPLFASETSQIVRNQSHFSKSQLLNMLDAREYQVVHLSLHGSFNNDDAMLSSLKLPNNDTLTAAEMFGLPLKHTQLVTLSACETGRVKVTDSNDVLGMQRALLYAGTQAMILPMWEIDATATAAWMKQFYQSA